MRFPTLSILAPAGIALLALAVGACGSDVKTRFTQLDGPVAGEHLFDGTTSDGECLTSVQCEDGDLCTENRCVDRRCVSFTVPTATCCESEVLFEDSFDDEGASGVSLAQLNSAAGWQVSKERAASPPGALYFGDPATKSYNTGEHVAGVVTLPKIKLPSDREIILSLRIYALIETNPAFDKLSVEADVIESGTVSATRTVLDKSSLPVDAYQGFALVSARLDELAGRTVILRIVFDSVDASNNNYEGVYLDDLRVLASCPIPSGLCASDEECDDGDQCTASACTEVGCVTTTVCELPGEDPLTHVDDSPCSAPDAPADCCVSDADCEDGDQATINVCDGATCSLTLNPDGCSGPGDCNDSDQCTVEACVEGVCQFTGTVGAGCCVDGTAHLADFDNETLQGIYVTDNFETGIFWRPDPTRATSGRFSLYCGDPIPQTYANDVRVKSSATTRPLAIPSGGRTAISFDLWKQTRTTRNYDVFTVFVLRDGALQTAWSSKALADGTTGGAWQRITVPLEAYAGQSVQVRFVFDSVDTPTGLFEGVYIDSISLDTRCN